MHQGLRAYLRLPAQVPVSSTLLWEEHPRGSGTELDRKPSLARRCLLHRGGARTGVRAGGGMINDLWYKNAVVYCLSVATFMDANGDGIGDFTGL